MDNVWTEQIATFFSAIKNLEFYYKNKAYLHKTYILDMKYPSFSLYNTPYKILLKLNQALRQKTLPTQLNRDIVA